MDWSFLDAVDKGLGIVAFLAFLRLVFGDLQEMKASLKRIEEHLALQAELARAQARARRKEKEVESGR